MTKYQLPALPAPAVPDIYEKSAETMQWLRQNIAVGFTDERGPTWWANGAVTKDGTWTEIPDGSHFPGAVPLEVVTRILGVEFAKGEVHVTYTDGEGHKQVASDPKVQPIVNVANGRVFSYPKSGYKIHPYLSTLSGFIQAIQYDQTVATGSVGLLKGGGQAFLQAVLPETVEVAGYGYQPYLMGVTSVDLSRSTSYSTGILGAVCDNTVANALTAALTSLKIKHTRNSGGTVQLAREKLGLRLADTAEQAADAITKLVNVDVSDADFAKWLDELRPVPEKLPEAKSKTGGAAYTNAIADRERLTAMWQSDPKVAPWAGTAFGALQLVNTDRTWNGKVRGVDGGRMERYFGNVANGTAAELDIEAMDKLAAVLDRKLTVAAS